MATICPDPKSGNVVHESGRIRIRLQIRYSCENSPLIFLVTLSLQKFFILNNTFACSLQCKLYIYSIYYLISFAKISFSCKKIEPIKVIILMSDVDNIVHLYFYKQQAVCYCADKSKNKHMFYFTFLKPKSIHIQGGFSQSKVKGSKVQKVKTKINWADINVLMF